MGRKKLSVSSILLGWNASSPQVGTSPLPVPPLKKKMGKPQLGASSQPTKVKKQMTYKQWRNLARGNRFLARKGYTIKKEV